MRNKRRLAAIALSLVIAIAAATTSFSAAFYTVDDAYGVADGILAYKEVLSGVSSPQEYIDTALSQNAGVSSEWYIITLSQSGNYNFENYKNALLSYLSSHTIYSATSRQKYALALIASGSGDSYISDTLDNSIGEQGIMSLIFGLHLLNNGYHSSAYSAKAVISELLGMEKSGGGWALMGQTGDVDVTAMAICALAPRYNKNRKVKAAVNRALDFLSEHQNPDGGYSGFGEDNAESTAQVLTALSSLGVDQNSDSRFIKNGNTVIDGLLNYRMSDGSFSHSRSGSTDDNATAQAYYSLVAYSRMKKGKTPLFILDKRNPSALKKSSEKKEEKASQPKAEKATEKKQETAKSPSSKTTTQSKQSQQKTNPTESAATEAAGSVSSSQGSKTAETASQTQTPSETTSDSAEPESTPTQNGETIAVDNGSLSHQADSAEPIKASASEIATIDSAQGSGPSYKLWAILAVIAAALTVAGILTALKKRNIKNYIFTAAVAAALSAAILFTNLSSKESYYNSSAKKDATASVTVSIYCDTVSSKTDSSYIPDDGVILKDFSTPIEEGDTVYDALIYAAKENGITVEARGGGGLTYVEGINYLYEFDFGELSGWMYQVNGVTASVGCRKYVLKDNDIVEWRYTENMGEDFINK